MSTGTTFLLLAAAATAVWVCPLQAQDPAAKVILLTGQVSVLRDGYPQALFAGSALQPQQIVVTGPASYAKFQLADGSTFEVFENARVVFRSNRFNWTDLIEVVLGRIRVQIDHSKGPNPNKVSTATAIISVRGTIFDVVVEDEDGTTLVSVEEGVVSVRHQLLPGKEVWVNPQQSVHVFRNQPLAQVVDKSPIIHNALNAARQALIELLYHRPSGTGVPGTVPASTGGAQGDKGKNGGGNSPTTPGAPTAPGAPGPPGGN